MYCRVESTSNIPGEALPQTHFVWQDQEEKALSRHKEAVNGRIRAYIATGILLTGLVTVQDIVDSYNAANDEKNAFTLEVEGSEFTGVSCPKSGQIDRVSMVVSEELVAEAESVEPLSEYIEYFMLLENIDEALDDEEAFKITSDYFNSKEIGLAVENDTDGIGLDRVTEVMPNKKQLQNLVMAMNTVPKSIIELSGLREIKLSNIIYSEKSTDQKEVETEKQISGKEHNTWGGYFSADDGVMGISTGSLESSGYSIRSVWHELVGHGAASKLCRPETDAEFYALAFNFLDEEIEYTPEWQQSNMQRVIFGSGKVTESSYGGTNIHEDVASVAEILMYGNPFEQLDDSILDEKRRLLIDRLALEEPNFAHYVYAVQNGLRYITLINDNDNSSPRVIHPEILANLAKPLK